MALFIIGLIAGFLAYKVGKWRNSCILWMTKNPVNTPLGWHKPEIRFGSFLLVTVLSIVFATCWSLLITTHVNKLLGMFAWGALLVIRWQASIISATLEVQRQLEYVDKMMNERKDDIFRP